MIKRRQRSVRETSLRRSSFTLRAGAAKPEVVANLLRAKTENCLAQRPIDPLAASQYLVIAEPGVSTRLGSS